MTQTFNPPPAMQRIHAMGALVVAWGRALLRAVRDEGLNYRATSLAYTSLVAIVPGLALSFSLLKTFGVHNQLEPLLLQMLAPLGDKAPELTGTILDFVKRVNVGLLGFVGLTVLAYTIVSMLGKIEAAFNHIWRVTQARSFTRRASDYLSVVLLGPVLIFSAIGLTASSPTAATVRRLIAQEPFGTLFFLGGKLLPFLLIIAAFTFVYIYIPNTRVPWRAALFGGTVGGLLWKLAGLLFAHFVAGSASYHAIYSSLVIVILFMIWLDLSWLILLLGGQAALYFQHPHYVRGHNRYADFDNRTKERLGLALMALIAARFVRGEAPWTLDELAERLALPWETVKDGLQVLRAGGLLEETGRGDESFVPAADLAGLTLGDVLRAMRQGPDAVGTALVPPEVLALADELEKAMAEHPAAGMSVREFVLRGKM
ncbi:YihY/virulence factor BrkB family protein [Methylomagnum sp.]